MITISKNTIKKLVFCFAIIGLATVSILNLRPGHMWGGDFSLYIRQASGIINNDREQIARDVHFMLENSTEHTFSPVAYPWGFPALLAPVVAAMGMDDYPSLSDFNVFKWYIVFFYIVFVLFYYLWVKNKFGGWIPVLLMVIVGFQPVFISWLNHIMSEMPYLCFIMLSFVCMDCILKKIQAKN